MTPLLGVGAGGLEEPHGFLVVRTDDDPAAGAETEIQVPGGRLWEVLSVLVDLTTDATVQNRRPALVVDDGTTEVLKSTMNGAIAASQAASLCWFTGAGASMISSLDALGVLPSPPLVLASGWRVRTETQNLQAGDNYGRPALHVREVPARGVGAELAHTLERLNDRLAALEPYLRGGAA